MEMLNKMKSQLTEWTKMFADYTCDKGVMSRIYKDLKKLNNHKTNNPVRNGVGRLGI